MILSGLVTMNLCGKMVTRDGHGSLNLVQSVLLMVTDKQIEYDFTDSNFLNVQLVVFVPSLITIICLLLVSASM